MIFLPPFISIKRFIGGDKYTKLGSQKCGVMRAKFILESVADLRKNLEKNGSGLVVAHGKAEDVFGAMCKSIDTEVMNQNGDGVGIEPHVLVQEEPCSEEMRVDKAVNRSVKTFKSGASGSFESVWGASLYDIDDLPYAEGVNGIPDTFTPFRNKVESEELQNPRGPFQQRPALHCQRIQLCYLS